jgi:M6 family metalloprotease-like protein
MLQEPSTYYNIASVWGAQGRSLQFLKDAILAWDSEIDYRKYDYVFVCGAGSTVWGYTYFQVPIAKTNDGITIDRATAQSENANPPTKQPWMVYAHEFGHLSLGLPDLYSFQIASMGPADFREAAVYVGPWDLMSRSYERSQIGAWGKMHVGWIPQNRVLEILPGQQGAAIIEPLENPTSGIQAIVIYLTATTYFLIENREPIGYDSVLPDNGILISYVDEGKYWQGNGPVVVEDANPGSGPRWQLLHPTFKIGEGSKSQYLNKTYNLAVALLDKQADNSYVVLVTTQDATNSAMLVYNDLTEANAAIKNATRGGRLNGLDQANASLQLAWNEFTRGNFQQAQSLALQSRSQADSAMTALHTTQTGQTQLPSTETRTAETYAATEYQAQILMAASVVAVAVLVIIRRRTGKQAPNHGESIGVEPLSLRAISCGSSVSR